MSSPATGAKPVSASICETTEIVLPNDTKSLGGMMGGRLLHLMDKCAAISAQRHANRVCVTAAVDSVEFQSAIREGEVVDVESRVNRAFRTSSGTPSPSGLPTRGCGRSFSSSFSGMRPRRRPSGTTSRGGPASKTPSRRR